MRASLAQRGSVELTAETRFYGATRPRPSRLVGAPSENAGFFFYAIAHPTTTLPRRAKVCIMPPRVASSHDAGH